MRTSRASTSRGCGVGVLGVLKLRAGGKFGLGALDGGWVVGGDGAAFGEQHLDQVDGGGFADVVGLALEGEAEDGEAFSAQRPEGGADLGEEALLLLGVDLFHLGEEVEVDAELVGDGAEGSDVLGEAGASVTDSGAEEAGADAAVEAHAAGDLLDVCAGGLAEVGDGVDEGDFEGEECVGGVLDDLRRLGGGEQQGRRGGGGAAAGDGVRLGVVGAGGEWGVDAGEQVGGGFGIGADDDAVRVEEVCDGGALAQELGVGDDVEEAAGDTVALEGAADPLVGVDRDGGFFDDDLVAGERAGDLAGDGFDVGEVCVAVLGLGGADGDEDGVRGARGFAEVGGEADFGVAVAFEEFGEVVLVDQGVAGLEGGDLSLVVIDTDHAVADLGEADGRDKADVLLNQRLQFGWDCSSYPADASLHKCNAFESSGFSAEAGNRF